MDCESREAGHRLDQLCPADRQLTGGLGARASSMGADGDLARSGGDLGGRFARRPSLTATVSSRGLLRSEAVSAPVASATHEVAMHGPAAGTVTGMEQLRFGDVDRSRCSRPTGCLDDRI